MTHLKVFLFKYNRIDNRLDVIEVPRWMTKRERECYERDRRGRYSDYTLCLGYDSYEVAERFFERSGIVSDETGNNY